MMFVFSPDAEAFPQYPWNISILSQRDAQLRIPINYVNGPGVTVTSACFGHGRYEDYATIKCISNLLSVPFRKFHVDLYWDSGRRIWSFCPVMIPKPADFGGGKLGSERSPAIQPRATDEVGISTVNTDFYGTVQPQTTTTIEKATVTVRVSTASSSTFAVLPEPTPAHAEEILYKNGPYTCSNSSALSLLAGIFGSYLDATDNTLEAAVRYIIFNLHSGASTISPEKPGPPVGQHNFRSASIGEAFFAALPEYLYTPDILREERSDLKQSWLSASRKSQPYSNYYSTFMQNGLKKTSDGWPSESVTEFQGDSSRRLYLGFGNVDHQMQEYNTDRDRRVIFPQGYLENLVQVEQTATGVVVDGCIFDPERKSLSAANSSWAISTDLKGLSAADFRLANYESALPAVSRMMACGISPLLNRRLLSYTVDENVVPYKEFAYSSIWSWAWGEPRLNGSNNNFRCAAMGASSEGRWHVADCKEEYRVACRVNNLPFSWNLSAKQGTYSAADSLCPDGSAFDLPRTAVENRYLLEEYRRHGGGSRAAPIWIDFNSIDIPACWVVGAKSECPYNVNINNSAQIYVPTIAGVIILVLAALLVLVKCGANRRQSRRKRRVGDGWDYEGIPS